MPTLPTTADYDRIGLTVGCSGMGLLMLTGWLLTAVLAWGFLHATPDMDAIREYRNRQYPATVGSPGDG